MEFIPGYGTYTVGVDRTRIIYYGLMVFASALLIYDFLERLNKSYLNY
ncbi:MAG: hypothetical protein LBC39_01950 [Methanobrevibacter sp.]|nr:hypothetical protein [Candidatus Methanovirga aequatorialis]